MTDPRAIQEQTRHYAHIRAALLARCPDLAALPGADDAA